MPCFHKIHFNYYPPICAFVSQAVPSLEIFLPKFYCTAYI